MRAPPQALPLALALLPVVLLLWYAIFGTLYSALALLPVACGTATGLRWYRDRLLVLPIRPGPARPGLPG